MKSQKNTAQMFVASNLANVASDTIDSLETKEVGIECILDSAGTLDPQDLFTTSNKASTGSIFKIIAKRADGELEISDAIAFDAIKSVSKYEYAGGNTQQVDYIGYNAVTDSGELDVMSDNAYQVFIKLKGNTMYTFAMDYKINGSYVSGSSDTQYGIASGIVNSFYTSLKYTRPDYNPLKFDVVSGDDGTALGTGVDTLTFTKGSNKFTATDIDDDTTNSAMAVGDMIRLGTTVASPVYKITAIDTANNIGTLDRVVQEDSTGVDTAYELIPVASQAAANFGVKISGQDTAFKVGYMDAELTHFTTSISDFGDSPLARRAVAPVEDPGRPNAIAQLEAELEGSKGTQYRNDPKYEYPDVNQTQVIGADGYDIVHIQFNKEYAGKFGDTSGIPNEIYVAIDETNDAAADFISAIGK